MGGSGGKWKMFVGEYRHSLDEKSRIVLPSKFRSSLSPTVYLSLGLDRCLEIVPADIFISEANEIIKMGKFNPQARALRRLKFDNSIEASIDKQGRIILPKNLLDKASIVKDVVILGDGDRIEIYASNVFDELNSRDLPNFEEIASSLANRKE